jgi:hypothetical protein
MVAITLAINYGLVSVGNHFYKDGGNGHWGMTSRLLFQAARQR